MHRKLLLLLSVFICAVNALNILGIFPYHGKSHFLVFKVFLEELSKRGHNVTVISHFPNEILSNSDRYHDISLAGSIEIFEDVLPMTKSYSTLLKTGLDISLSGAKSCEILVSSSKVQDLLKCEQKFDVIIAEQFNSDCSLGVAYKLNAPVVGINSGVLLPFHYKRFGVPYNPSYIPFHFLGGGIKPTLFQRIERGFYDLYFNALYYMITQRSEQKALKEYVGDVPSLEELAREIKFMLLYTNHFLTGSRFFPANVIEVGGYHIREPKPLTNGIKIFMDEAEHGVTYVSFGTVIKSTTLSPGQLEVILESMKELPQKFIWKWDNRTIINMDKDKLYTAKWLPQADILAHPKTVAFFSHSGMLGITEAIHFGVPIVGMPLYGDQPGNAAAVEECGLGVQLQLGDLTKETLVNAFKKVLSPAFRSNVKTLSSTWHDRPVSALDEAIFWTEFAAKYPNNTFRTPVADVPLYQYLCLDILLVVAISVFVVVSAIIMMWNVFKKSIKKNQQKITKIKGKNQ